MNISGRFPGRINPFLAIMTEPSHDTRTIKFDDSEIFIDLEKMTFRFRGLFQDTGEDRRKKHDNLMNEINMATQLSNFGHRANKPFKKIEIPKYVSMYEINGAVYVSGMGYRMDCVWDTEKTDAYNLQHNRPEFWCEVQPA